MKNHSNLHKYTLAANNVLKVVSATGTKMFVRTASQPFKAVFDTGAVIELEGGFRFTSESPFSRIELTNPNTADLYVEFYIGDASVERDAPTYVRDAPTTIGPNSATDVLAPGHFTNTFPAAPAGKHRKEVVIGNQNATAGNELQIWVEYPAGSDAFQAAGFVPAASSFVLQSNTAFQIKNNAGSPITYFVMELLYA